jgi:uncharacterized membrane protein YbjE (DUF340 family)
MVKYLELLLDFLKLLMSFDKEKILESTKNNLDNVLFIISIILGFILGYLFKKYY